MVKMTIELLRKRAEHHDHQLAPLKEISLHQESIEKIECLQECCPKLQILLLQSNIISKIENLNRLKELVYLNLAINNIEVIENLEHCESLQKLDLTLNFIGDVTSLKSLRNNYNLQYLYLSGNPCSDYEGYRKYVIVSLPQLEELDSEEIKKSDRILAFQSFHHIEDHIKEQQETYRKKRLLQKERLEKKIQEKWSKEDNELSEEEIQRFWSEKSENSPECRIEMERLNQIKRDAKKPKDENKIKKPRAMFAVDGRPYNINEAKIPFKFNDEKINYFDLEIQLYKHLDTSLIDLDLQPTYVRLVLKNKIFQLALPEEININDSTAKRSQTTGYLLITMKKFNATNIIIPNETVNKHKNKNNMNEQKINVSTKREFLEIGPPEKVLDLTKMTIRNAKFSKSLSQSKVQKNFEDDMNVPPLI